MRNAECGTSEAEPEDLRERTKRFALRVIGVCDVLGEHGKAGVIARQLIRCGTSVGAQFREAKRARSDAELVSKLESASQELEETSYWLELLCEGKILDEKRLRPLMNEADEIMRILVRSVATVKSRRPRNLKKR